MDSSSDNDEFYECDDDLDEDEIDTDSQKVGSKEDHKKLTPAAGPTTKLDNSKKLETNTIKSVTNNKPDQKTFEDNKKTISKETFNNNSQEKDDTRENIENSKETSNITTDAAKLEKQSVEIKNNNSNVAPAKEISTSKVETTDLDSDNNELSKTFDEKCNINVLSKNIPEVKKCDISQDATSKNMEKSILNVKKSSEDDMWDDNDWGDFDQNPKEIKELPKSPKQGNKEASSKQIDAPTTKKQDIASSSTNKNLPTEENLWDDEDDWGKLGTESRPEPEEDLWGEGDGWGVETPQETPKKQAIQKTSPLQSKTHKTTPSKGQTEENDLWAEGDNWGINDTGKTKTDAKSALDTLTAKEDTSWGGWSNWGISSVLSTAANITTSVSQGITTVLESGIGVPDPEELARLHKAQAEQRKLDGEEPLEEEAPQDDFVPFGLGNFVPGVSTITKLVETTGTKVITKGLGTLETIGKKTYEVLQENDPQLKKKRALLKLLEADKPVLSSILREAKERAETENKEREMRHFARKANYETMFDDYTGLVHLEALEMLSKQCDIKLESIMSQSLDVTEMQETMEQIKDLCELHTEDDDEEFTFNELKSKMEEAINEINIGITCEKVIEVFVELSEWIENADTCNKDEIHSNAIENLAKLTATAVEQYHKAGELLLIKQHRSTADEADSLVQLTTAISSLISLLSTKYTEKLKTCSNTSPDEIKTLISNIYLEAANSSRYVEDAFGLLIPVIQVGAV